MAEAVLGLAYRAPVSYTHLKVTFAVAFLVLRPFWGHGILEGGGLLPWKSLCQSAATTISAGFTPGGKAMSPPLSLIHIWALAHGLQAFQHLDLVAVVGLFGFRHIRHFVDFQARTLLFGNVRPQKSRAAAWLFGGVEIAFKKNFFLYISIADFRPVVNRISPFRGRCV